MPQLQSFPPEQREGQGTDEKRKSGADKEDHRHNAIVDPDRRRKPFDDDEGVVDQLQGRPAHSNPRHRGQTRQQQDLAKHLAEHRAPTRAERHADREFRPLHIDAGQHEVRHVHPADQQHQQHPRFQRPQRLPRH